MDDNSYENYETFPKNVAEAESAERAELWGSAMNTDVPSFSGEDAFGAESTPGMAGSTESPISAPGNMPGDTPLSPAEAPSSISAMGGLSSVEGPSDGQEAYNESISNAAAIINYGLNAAAQKYGVENVVQKIKTLDVTNSVNPIKDLYDQLGVDYREEKQDLAARADAMQPEEAEFRTESEVRPYSDEKTLQGAFYAIEDMKKLIQDVESADPRYNDLRAGADAAGMGYFEYAVKGLEEPNLVKLFTVLSQQRERVDDGMGEPAIVDTLPLDTEPASEQSLEIDAEPTPTEATELTMTESEADVEPTIVETETDAGFTSAEPLGVDTEQDIESLSS